MMTLLGILVFSAALGIAGWTILATIAPQIDRIVAALAGRSQASFQPLGALVIAERHIAVRRWSAMQRAPVLVRAAA